MSNQKAFTATVTGDGAHDFQPFLGFFALTLLNCYSLDSHHLNYHRPPTAASLCLRLSKIRVVPNVLRLRLILIHMAHELENHPILANIAGGEDFTRGQRCFVGASVTLVGYRVHPVY